MIRLVDEERGVVAWINLEQGNRVASLSFQGDNVLRDPGMPFLAPWANRMPGGFHADGRYSPLNLALGNLELDAVGIPIHGLLSNSRWWEVVRSGSSFVTSRLEFWRHRELMAQWPFAHQYEVTYRLDAGVLEVNVEMQNLAAVRMPVAIGFHPYFTLPGVPRDHCRVRVPAGLRIVHDERVLATGELLPAELPELVSLAGNCLDSGYTGLEEDACFRIEGGGKAVAIQLDRHWPVVILWGPEGKDFLCVEPMAAPTDGINLHHRGLWPGLQWIAPGAAWRGSFRIAGHGF